LGGTSRAKEILKTETLKFEGKTENKKQKSESGNEFLFSIFPISVLCRALCATRLRGLCAYCRVWP
jgi:hypothetical protein